MSNPPARGWIRALGPLILLPMLLAPASADVFVDAAAVCAPCNGSAGAPFPTIQEGIDAAVSGEIVRVAPGTYVENLVVIGKAVHLLGTGGAAQTTIDGGGLASVIYMDDVGDSTVEGFTITGGSSPFGAGIEVLGGLLPGEPTITRNVITGNDAISVMAGYDGDGGAIDLYFGVDAVIVDNLVHGNTAVRQGAGINVVNSDFAVVAFNTIVGNSGATNFGPGISVVFGGGQVLANNIIAYNSGNDLTGAIDSYQAGAAITGNLLHGNTPADFVSTPAGPLPAGNLTGNPRFYDAAAQDYHLRLDSPAVDAANPIVTEGAEDLDGNPRPVDADRDGSAVADIGAYEQLGTIERLGVTGAGLVSWTAAFVAPDAYHVYRSSRGDLLAGNVGACQDARDPNLTDTFFDETQVPAVGEAFLFVVNFERHSARASLGLSTAGVDRGPGVPCP